MKTQQIECDGLGDWMVRSQDLANDGMEFDLLGLDYSHAVTAGAAPRPTMVEWCGNLAKRTGMRFTFNPDKQLGLFRKGS